jgi:serine/threonine-protein kinase
MASNEFTSGPLRDFSSLEAGTFGFSDIELLSDSGHNNVYRAKMSGKWVVLKTAKQEEGAFTRNQLLLEREFEIMNRLDCIYVVQAIAMVDVPQLGRAILMEYVNGRPLDQYVSENPSNSERQRVADELMETLIFLHERQVVHGDLKPSNILITETGNHVRLIDFGFSDNDSYIAKNIGTSPSVSVPEQLPNDVLIPERDIYALGKMLALLFPHSAQPVVRRCLAPQSRRYNSVHQVRLALRRLRLIR